MPYHVVLLNDNEHTFDYVIDMLMLSFSMSEDKAIEHAMDVHINGRTIVMICEKEDAEIGRDRILGCGPDARVPRSRGSMQAAIDPAE